MLMRLVSRAPACAGTHAANTMCIDGWRKAQPHMRLEIARSRHQLKTATAGSHAGHALALRPKLMSGRTGAIALAKYVSKSDSGVNSCVSTSAC